MVLLRDSAGERCLLQVGSSLIGVQVFLRSFATHVCKNSGIKNRSVLQRTAKKISFLKLVSFRWKG